MEPKIMALNKNKTDAKLGLEIHTHLVDLGVETPLMTNEGILDLKDSSQIELITNYVFDCDSIPPLLHSVPVPTL